MQYCFDCDSYNCHCWLEEYNEYIATEAEAKESLPKLLEAMEVTKEEIKTLIDWIKSGRLYGVSIISPYSEDCGCLIGLTAIMRGEYIDGLMPDEYYNLSSAIEGDKYAAIQKFIYHPENHALVIQWLEELL